MLEELNASLDLTILQTKANGPILAIIILLPLCGCLLSRVYPRLLYLGIIPRKIYGLFGLIFAPLLHSNFNHLFFNAIPLLVLSNFLLIQGLNYFITVTIFITILSGFLVWCFGKPGIHIGASSVITGYWAVLVADILRQGTLTAIILGGLSIYYFGAIFLGIFPGKKGVSWEGHLFGLFAGFTAAYVLNPS